MSTSFWLDRSKAAPTKSYDVAIVGGGIAGLSCAYWLRKEDPSLKVVILEKSRMAFGASGRNAGFITCGSVEHFNRLVHKHGAQEASEIWRFSEINLELLREHIIQDKGAELQFEDRGTFSLASTEPEWKELQGVAKLMAEMNIGVDTLDQAAVSKRLGVKGFIGGIKYLKDAAINPVLLLREMYKKSGAEMMELTEVHGIDMSPSGGRLVRTDNGTIEANMVILSLNGYSASLHPYFADKIFATRGQILVTEPVERFMEGPCYANFYLDYFRQLAGGEFLVGGFRQLEKETEVGYSDHITPKIQAALDKFIQDHLPPLQGKKITHRWAGVMGFSVDGQPMIGSLPEDQQTMFVGGFTAHGIGLAFHSAKCLTDLIFGREIPKWLSARRFGS
ncbi:MAG TPA: FAD-binding oxidoreductase [Bdellovibrionales bacterium]|nr:FAD-binding oxidoreductase [Bdellovibrionales bacterium]